MSCKICLKEHQFCTCIGAEKKHAAHVNKLNKGLLGEPKSEDIEIFPEIKKDEHSFGIPLADDEAKESVEQLDKEPKKFFGRKHKNK